MIQGKREFQILGKDGAHFCTPGALAPLEHEMRRRPAIGCNVQALQKILIDNDLVVSGRQLIRVASHYKRVAEGHS